MSETMPTDTDEDLEDVLDPKLREELRSARATRRQADEATKRADAAERELAFARAGIPDDAKGQMFRKAYEGDSADPAAVKAAFDEVFGEPQKEPIVPEAELEAQRRIAQAGTGATAGGTVEFADALRSAGTESEVMDLARNAPNEAKITVPEVPF